jgi:methylmalonyl-CoA mutase N-terminal domain/subunit
MTDSSKTGRVAAFRKWGREVLEPFLEKRRERRGKFTTLSGTEVDRLYLPGDTSYLEKLGFPGEYPFTRGVYPTMYRGRLWTMRQYAGFGDAEETNRRYRYLLEQGQTGLSVAFDLCTQIGYDSDHPLCAGEVGKVGVAIDSLADMERLFEGIPLDRVSTSMTINAPAAILLAMVVAVAEKQGVSRAKLSGTVQNDILKEYVARGTYIFPPAPSMRLATDLMRYCADEMPSWNTISVSGYHMREAGCTAAQEVGFTLADGIAYVGAAVGAGIDVDRFARRISFFFAAHNDVLEEIAKYRAARRLWARVMRERFAARESESMMLRFHVQTAGCSLTAQQPENNIARVAFQALAAAAGGAQSLHTNSFDEALALPSEKAATVALRTQQILAHESGIANTVDPLGGSYYVEALTDRIEKAASDYIEKIDELGGAVRAIDMGYMQREIQRSSYEYQKGVEEGRNVVVGMNEFRSGEAAKPRLLQVDEAVEKKQVEGLERLRASRDAAAVRSGLAALEEAARGDANLMPAILEAARAYCTVGEISDVLRGVFGEHREKVVL